MLGNIVPPAYPTFSGVRVRLDPTMVEYKGVSWAGCRSVPRAKRRAKKGHPQRTIPAYGPKMECVYIRQFLVMHPAAWEVLKAASAAEPNRPA